MVLESEGKGMNESGDHFRVTMFFPLSDNDGNAFEEEIWEWWRDELTKILSGFTDLGVVSGWWQGQSDQNQSIVAIVESEEQWVNSEAFSSQLGKCLGKTPCILNGIQFISSW